jgi:uncharacterized protein YlxW (UPF0749 family)
MKTLFALLVPCLLACAIAAQGAEPSKESERDQQQIAALAKEVQSQQAAIAENQTKINEKIAAIAEALRQARIYAGRGR